MFEKLIKHESYEVIRATDPGIYHLWHDKLCSLTQLLGDESKYYMCMGARAMMEGDKRELALKLATVTATTTKQGL